MEVKFSPSPRRQASQWRREKIETTGKLLGEVKLGLFFAESDFHRRFDFP